MGGFHTVTLGCKLNRFDSAAIEGELARRGLAFEADPALAAIVVVNTCTVTGRADADARKRIRRIRRINPGCRLLVTGCYAERAAAELRAIQGVDHVFGNAEKPRVGEILDALLGGRDAGVGSDRAGGDRGCDGALTLPPALHFGERSRAFLKVQEGCRLSCSYCVIPEVRGPSRSAPPERVAAAAAALLRAGYREIVLTGVNVGDYGRDLDPPATLAGLLRLLLARSGPNRIRLNSLEPRTVTDEIVELMANEPRLAPHLQVPLQSGADAVLRGMRRNYRVADYLDRVRAVRRAIPDAGLGADVIVGFPGESDAHFRQTCDLVASSPLNYLHVFPWSSRPGTPAATMPGRVDPGQVRERAAALRALGQELSLRFRRGLVGRELDAVVLGARRGSAARRALTGNFIEVALGAGNAFGGDLLRVRLTAATRDRTDAREVGTPVWAPPRPRGIRRSGL